MKKLLIICGIILGVLLSVALVGPGFIDWNQYKSEITTAARDVAGLDLEIDGDLSFRVIPSPELSASGLKLANAPGAADPNIVELESLDIRVAFLPLISGNLQVETLVLQGPRISLERLADGRGNWEALEGDTAEPEAAPAPRGGGPPRISLKSVRIEDGRLAFREAGGEAIEIAGIDADISADAITGPFETAGSFVYNGVAVGYEAALGRYEAGKRLPTRATLSLADAEMEFSGSLQPDQALAGVDGRLQLSGASAKRLIEAVSQLAGAEAGLPEALDEALTLDTQVERVDGGLALNPLTLRLGETAGEGQLTANLGERRAVEATLNLNAIDLDRWLGAETGEQPKSKDDAPFSLPDAFDAKLTMTVGALSYRDRIIRRANLNAELKDGALTVTKVQALLPGGSDLSVGGVLTAAAGKPAFSGSLRAVSNNLRGLLTWLGTDLSTVPEGQLTTLTMDASIALTDEALQIYGATGQLDISQFEGGVTVGLAERPAFGIEAKVNRINLDSYLPPASEDPAQGGPPSESLREALKPLADFDAGFDVEVDQMTLSGAVIRSAVIDATLLGGVFKFGNFAVEDILDVKAGFSGQISGLAADPVVDGRIDIQSEDVSRFARWAGIDLPLPGPAIGRTVLQGRVQGGLDNLTLDLNNRVLGGGLDVTGTLGGVDGDRPVFDLDLNLRHRSHRDLIGRLDPEFNTGGPAGVVDLRLELAGAADDFRLDIQGQMAGATLRLNGRVGPESAADRYNFQASLSHPSVKQLAQALDIGYAEGATMPGGFSLAAAVSGNDEVLQVSDITGEMGVIGVAGTLRLDRRGERPSVAVTLNAGDVLLDPYLAPRSTGADIAAQGAGERWSQEPIPLDGFKKVDLDLALSAEMVSASGYVFVEPQATVMLKDGVLEIPALTGRLFDGPVRMAARLNSNGRPQLTVDMAISGASLEKALATSAAISPATGQLDMNGSFAANGFNQLQMISTLKGQAVLAAAEGVIRGIDLERLSDRMMQLERVPDFVSLLGAVLRQGETPYSQIMTTFVAERGVLTAKQLTADVPAADLTGDARIDLPRWAIAANGQMALSEHTDTPPIGVSIAGSIDDPAINYQTAALRNFMTQRLASAVFRDFFGVGEQPAETPQSGGPDQPLAPEQSQQPPPKPGEELGKLLFESLFGGRRQNPPPDDQQN